MHGHNDSNGAVQHHTILKTFIKLRVIPCRSGWGGCQNYVLAITIDKLLPPKAKELLWQTLILRPKVSPFFTKFNDSESLSSLILGINAPRVLSANSIQQKPSSNATAASSPAGAIAESGADLEYCVIPLLVLVSGRIDGLCSWQIVTVCHNLRNLG